MATLTTKVTHIITTKTGNKITRQIRLKGEYTYANISEANARVLVAAIAAACTT